MHLVKRNLRGRVRHAVARQFPIGGVTRVGVEPASRHVAGRSGVRPGPTVQSGWKKVWRGALEAPLRHEKERFGAPTTPVFGVFYF